MTKNDRYIVLATDGLWDELSRKNSAKVATAAEKTFNGDEEDATRGNHQAKNLLKAALDNVCKTKGVTRDWLSQVPPGRQRRGIVDDITMLVLDLDNQVVK